MYSRETGRSSNQHSDVPKQSMEKKTQSSSQPAWDRAKQSDKPTLKNPGLYEGMQVGSDGASTSDGSKSRLNKMLDLMQETINDKKKLANELNEANQKIQELNNRLKQAFREKEELANQLKEVRLGETSSLQKGDAEFIIS